MFPEKLSELAPHDLRLRLFSIDQRLDGGVTPLDMINYLNMYDDPELRSELRGRLLSRLNPQHVKRFIAIEEALKIIEQNNNPLSPKATE